MNKLCRLTLAVLMVLSLFGCAAKSNQTAEKKSDDIKSSVSTTSESITSSKTNKTNKSGNENKKPVHKEPVTEAEMYDIGSDIAVISIKTKDNSEDALDFVTEPVSRHVAESISSWTPGYKMPPEPYYEECTLTLTDADDSVLLDCVDARVKVRGNWTTDYEKKPLRINFTEKQNMLGLNDGAEMKNWVLLAEYKDWSMLRNKTALSIAREILGEDGLYVADAEFVEVEINEQYWGVYLLTEMQQINSNRVNITEAEKNYAGTDIGYFMEFDGYYVNEEPLQSIYVDYADNAELVPFDGNDGSGKTIKCLPEGSRDEKRNVGITIKSDIYSQQQHDFIETYMNNVYKIMYYSAYEDKAYEFNSDFTEIVESEKLSPQEAVEKVVDVKSLADVYIINEIACDADIYWSSFFMDVDFGADGCKKLTFEAPWDYDSALGNKDRCADGQGMYAANIVPDVNNIYETINPWLAVLMHEEWFCDIIREKWTNAYDAGVFESIYQMIEDDTEQYSDAFERNYMRWNNIIDNDAIEGELSRNALLCKDHAQASEYLSDWLRTRVEFLNGYWHS